MLKASDTIGREDPFGLSRFINAQDDVYNDVLTELKSGLKRTHWMWFIFPQIDGLGHSPTTEYYAIKNIEEARKYLAHPVLGPRLLECAEAVLSVEGRSVSQIFGYPDDFKLKSSMTLFAFVSDPDSAFVNVLNKYFHGEHDIKTLQILENLKAKL
jgi:uncharacterized protein (DUF1810 family)